MLNRKVNILSKYKQISAIILLCIFSDTARAEELNAGAVLNQFNYDQRYGYVSGVIEGLAYARFLQDKPNEDGMKCIYDWYYQGGVEAWNKITAYFNRHQDKPVGALLYVLSKRECGA